MPFNFEEVLAIHCSPTFCGVKSANLFNCNKTKFPKIKNYINEINKLKNISCYILNESNENILLLIYNKKNLENKLNEKLNYNFLYNLNYPYTGLFDNLNYLKERIQKSNSFPHEIGIFLDYPLEDVVGFLNNEKSLYTGYWKVYKNVDEKIKLFSKYNECREYFLDSLYDGKKIHNIINFF